MSVLDWSCNHFIVTFIFSLHSSSLKYILSNIITCAESFSTSLFLFYLFFYSFSFTVYFQLFSEFLAASNISSCLLSIHRVYSFFLENLISLNSRWIFLHKTYSSHFVRGFYHWVECHLLFFYFLGYFCGLMIFYVSKV